MSLDLKPPPQITATARPIRVAYVIEDGPDVHSWLDAAFGESFGRHGGRQTLIVPVVDGKIDGPYMAWLNAFDPDVLLLATYESAGLVETLSSALAPPLIMTGLNRKRDEVEKHPRINLEQVALTSLSWLPFLKVRSGGFRARPERILDSYPQWCDDGLITDNFGTLQSSFSRFPLHPELLDQVRPLVLTPKGAPENRWHFKIDGDEITDGYDFLEKLSRPGHTLTLAYLSNIYSKHLRIQVHPWINSFCLIIGDTFEDRVLCWNSGLLYDDAQHQAYKSLRVPAEAIKDPSRVDRIGKFLRDNNWIGQSNSPAHITVRSFSIGETSLAPFVEQLKKCTHSFVKHERIASLNDCCPTKQEDYWLDAGFDRPQLQIPLRHETEIVPVPQPLQLEHANIAHPSCSTGRWMVDYKIDRVNDNSRASNARDDWSLPKRSQIARLFFPSGESRISLIGAISVPVDYKMENVRITYPSDAEFFGTLLHQAPSYPYWDLRSKLTYPVAYKYSRLSDKGRYLQGVLGMFQSLGSAHDVLMCHFWRNQLTKLAIPSQEQRPALIERLKKRLRSQASKVHIETEANWDRLARAVEREVNTLRSPRHTVQLKVLLDEWREELSAAIDADNNLKSRKVELLAEADSELKSSLDSLTRLGVFHQGYDWHCPHCGYRNWNAIDSLRAALACQVCHQERHIPVDLVLDFRLNEFFATCLREHDTLTMIWALGQLQRDAKASFIFTPQIDLFRKYPESRASTNDRELDLLCVVDGKVIIGEVKTSLSEIDSAEVDSLVELANELKPDIVIVAAMMGDREIMVEKLGQIRSRIPTNIEVKDLLSSNSDTELSLYLP